MPFRRPGYGRGGLIALLAVAHAGGIAAASIGGPALVVTPLPAITVSEVREAVPALPVTEPKLVALATRVDEPSIEIAGEAPPVAPMALAATPSGNGCAGGDVIETVLRTRADVHTALDAMPRAARSVADAVLLWNGRWIGAGQVGGAGAIDPIRAAVVTAVRAMPAGCRDATITGPRFVFVALPSGNRILTFGSGEWTWAQVLTG